MEFEEMNTHLPAVLGLGRLQGEEEALAVADVGTRARPLKALRGVHAEDLRTKIEYVVQGGMMEMKAEHG